jgi:hypothetical protein
MSGLWAELAGGQLNALDIVLWTVMALLLSVAGGAAAGVALAGKDLGNALAAAMGAMFGPVAAVPGVLLALIVLAWF